MKPLFISIICLLSSCSSPPEKVTYTCINPMMVLNSVTIPVPSDTVKDLGSSLQVTTQEGNVLTISKSLCLKIKEPQ